MPTGGFIANVGRLMEQNPDAITAAGGNYVAENGSDSYVTENGASNYVTES